MTRRMPIRCVTVLIPDDCEVVLAVAAKPWTGTNVILVAELVVIAVLQEPAELVLGLATRRSGKELLRGGLDDRLVLEPRNRKVVGTDCPVSVDPVAIGIGIEMVFCPLPI